jgi:hypothetical protein
MFSSRYLAHEVNFRDLIDGPVAPLPLLASCDTSCCLRPFLLRAKDTRHETQHFRNMPAVVLAGRKNDRKFNPALFVLLADGHGLALIRRCRTLR